MIPSAALTARVAESAATVRSMAPARLYELLTPGLCGKHPHVALQWLLDAGVLGVVLPELEATVALSQERGRQHKDVWEHTKVVVMQAVPRPAVRWAAALHDIGKVTTRAFVGGRVTFHGHAEEGVRLFRRGPARRIGFPTPVGQRVDRLILHHQRPGQYTSSWTDSAVRRFARDMGPCLRDVLDLSRADVTSRRPGQRRRCLFAVSELSRRIAALQAQDARVSPIPSGLGRVLMERLGLEPGPRLGAIRRRLIALCEAGELASRQPADYYVDAALAHGLLDAGDITRAITASDG